MQPENKFITFYALESLSQNPPPASSSWELWNKKYQAPLGKLQNNKPVAFLAGCAHVETAGASGKAIIAGGKELGIFSGCRTHCTLKGKKKASVKQEEEFIAFVRVIYRVQISYCSKYLIWLCCHAQLFSIAVAGTKQEINANKDAKGAFRYELIQIASRAKVVLIFQSCKNYLNFFVFRFSTWSFSSPFILSFPLCMSEQITAWSVQGNEVLAGVNWRGTDGIFLPLQSNILHWTNNFLQLFGAKEVEKWLGETTKP